MLPRAHPAPQAPAAWAGEGSRRCHSPPEGDCLLSLLGAGGVYRSVAFTYSFAEGNLWAGLNLVRKGKKKNLFSRLSASFISCFPCKKGTSYFKGTMPEKPSTREPPLSPFILPFNLKGFPQCEDRSLRRSPAFVTSLTGTPRLVRTARRLPRKTGGGRAELGRNIRLGSEAELWDA